MYECRKHYSLPHPWRNHQVTVFTSPSYEVLLLSRKLETLRKMLPFSENMHTFRLDADNTPGVLKESSTLFKQIASLKQEFNSAHVLRLPVDELLVLEATRRQRVGHSMLFTFGNAHGGKYQVCEREFNISAYSLLVKPERLEGLRPPELWINPPERGVRFAVLFSTELSH